MSEYYKLIRVPSMGVTRALLTCSLCGETIDTQGGPDHSAICIPCGEFVINQQAVGIIIPEPVEEINPV